MTTNTPKHYPSGTPISAIVSDQQRRSSNLLLALRIKSFLFWLVVWSVVITAVLVALAQVAK